MTNNSAHSNAYIHPNAKIGENTVVSPFAYIDDDVQVGDNCWIAPHAVLMPGARIGNNCRIFTGAVIASIPQDLKFQGEYSTAEIGDNTTVREYATINRGTKHRKKTVIGKNVLVMSYAHIAHDCIIHDNAIIVNSVQIAGHVEVGEHAIISGMSAVHQFVKIGAHSMITGGSLVRKDVPPFVLAGKEPLCYQGVNLIGLKRRSFSREQISNISNMYKILYENGKNNTQAVEFIQEKFNNSTEKKMLVDFVSTSERGIIRGSNRKDGND